MVSSEVLIELKNILEQERDQLVKELSAIAKFSLDKDRWETRFPSFEVGENYSHTQKEEEADEVEEYEVRIATEHSLESRLLEVTKALNRIHTNQYGLCPKCHREISLERLRANPAAEYHVEHQN